MILVLDGQTCSHLAMPANHIGPILNLNQSNWMRLRLQNSMMYRYHLSGSRLAKNAMETVNELTLRYRGYAGSQ